MKSRILKIVTVMLLLATLMLTNFIYVGVGLISYAADNIATNNQNVEFDAQLKEENILSLTISVKKEGYFNGEIALENSNFSFATDSSNNYINKIESDKITLNQLNAGSTAEIDLKIEPINKDIFDVSLLSRVSKLNLTGIYKDSTQKDINIKATREVTYEYSENNTNENIESTTKIITNKVMKVSGEDKRVVQLEVNLGLKENNYPIKEIEFTMDIPTVDGKQPAIVKKIDFNTMTKWDYEYKDSIVKVKFTNEPNQENKILWRKQGNEKVVLTLIYNKEAKLENAKYENTTNDSAVGQPNVKVTLYNQKVLSSIGNLTVEDLKEEKDSVIEVTAKNAEDTIYKGKINAGIDRQYETKTNISVNLANVGEYINIKENPTNYILNDDLISANVIYNKTVISKEDFDKIFGQNGIITILDVKDVIATIDNSSQVDENGNIVIDYTEKEPSAIEIKTSTPIAEGDLEITHTKTIKGQDKQIVEKATELRTSILYEYDTVVTNEAEAKTKLEEAKTEARLELDKETLSTIVGNTVEMKAVLKGNSEQYNLYNNPTITFELPEEVEKIELNSDPYFIYETELKVKDYNINGRTLTINIEGKQTEYKNLSIEGAILVVNASVTVDKKASTKDAQITMTYNNDGTTAADAKTIKIVAPKDITTINSIKELDVETIGQEETKQVTLQRGTDVKQLETEIEVINNNENAIENVKIMGTFPTKNDENNIEISVIEGIALEGVEGAKIYYTENDKATEDVQDSTNGWKNEIVDSRKIRKYLIVVPNMQAKSSIKGTYKIEIPALLEYNQTATQGYSVKYTNTLTNTENEMKATTIQLQTGVGPILEAKLIPMLGGSEVATNSTVKNGEVIKYKIEISNIGSEEITDITVQGNVPEGTTLVEPQDNYEYTGSSYYKELTDTTYESKIDKIKVGEVITKEYEVRVNVGVEAGTKLLNTTQVKYGDVVKKSNETQLITANGDLRVSVKRVTDRNVDLYEAGTVRYFAIIENISNENQENITVKTNLLETLEVTGLTLITGMESKEVSDDQIYRDGDVEEEATETRKVTESELTALGIEDNIISEELEYKDEVNIGTLKAGESKVLCYDLAINKVEDSNQVNFSVIAKNGSDEYKSNTITDNIVKTDISLSMATNTQSQYVKAGDIIEYTITIKNNGTERVEGINIKDTIPASLTVNKVSFDGEEIENLKEVNDIEISCDIAAKSEGTIKIETVVNYSAGRTQAEPITNVAYAEMLGEKIATTSEINHIIEANKTEDAGDSDEERDKQDSDIAKGSKMITGVAWFDENANGQKDDSEKTLANIKVHLLNTETNNFVKDTDGNVLEATTNDNGLYVLNNIEKGKYIVVFEYENTKYALTKYKAENVDETTNSDAMTNELVIESEKQQVTSTDIIEINNENISGINIGLIELKDFSFRLDKYISKILIQNSAGTTVKEYTDATVAKAELDAKKVNGTNVIIEYKIKVTNIGEIDGYVKKIVDYVPSDLKFSSELNKDWYQSGEDLYNISLANEKIAAEESREVTLTLTKAMTENNTGLINNTAEIAESYNELGIADSKSTPGNKVQGESDYGSADAILSLKTGGEVYIVTAAIILVALGTIAFIVIRKRKINGDKK